MFIKDTWLACPYNLAFTHSEYLALNISNGCWSWCLLALYRPPSTNVNGFLDELKTFLNVLQTERQLCLIGDINIDTSKIDKPYIAKYLDLIAEFGIESGISSPTREERGLEGKTC